MNEKLKALQETDARSRQNALSDSDSDSEEETHVVDNSQECECDEDNSQECECGEENCDYKKLLELYYKSQFDEETNDALLNKIDEHYEKILANSGGEMDEEILNIIGAQPTEDEDEEPVIVMMNVIEEVCEITSNRCAAHSSALGGDKDMLSITNDMFLPANELCIWLRKPSNRSELRKRGIPIPPSYCLTRWMRRFLIMLYLVNNSDKIKIFLADKNERKMMASDWKNCEDYVKTYQSLYYLLLFLEKDNISYADFLHKLNETRRQLEQLELPLAQKLLGCLNERMKSVLNPLAYAICWLSPYGNVWLRMDENEELKTQAIQYLRTFITKMANSSQDAGDEATDTEQNESVTLDNISNTSELAQMFRLAKLQSSNSSRSNASLITTVETLSFEPQDLIDSMDKDGVHLNNIEWWNNQGGVKYPVLLPLVRALFSAQPTQVFSERIFSKLKLILEDLRMNLGDEVINMLIMINSNWDIIANPKFRLDVKTSPNPSD